MSSAPEHLPARPSWDCLACGQPWPCGPAREQLLATHTPTELAIHLWTVFEDAVQDLHGTAITATIERFVTWPRRRAI